MKNNTPLNSTEGFEWTQKVECTQLSGDLSGIHTIGTY